MWQDPFLCSSLGPLQTLSRVSRTIGCRRTASDLARVDTVRNEDEIEALLSAIYNGVHVDLPELTVENFPLAASILRTATRYGVDRLRDDVLATFRQEWPSTLPAHIAKFNAFKSKLQPLIIGQNGAQIPNPQYDPDASDALIVHPAAVIAVLRESEIEDTALFASLFYDLSRRTWQLNPHFSGHHLNYLSPADVERLLYGTAALRAAHARMASTSPTFAFPTQAHAHHHNANNHPRALAMNWTTATIPRLLHDPGQNSQCEPVEDWEAARKQAAHALPLLAGDCICVKSTLDYISTCQTTLWDHLSVYFGLE